MRRFLQLKHVFDGAFNIAGRTLRAARDLVNHDVGIRQGEAFAFRPRREQDRAHAGRHPQTIGGHVTGQKLHRVVNCQARRDGAAWRVDVKVDVFFPVFHLEEQKLRDDQIGDVIVDLRPDKNDPVL